MLILSANFTGLKKPCYGRMAEQLDALHKQGCNVKRSAVFSSQSDKCHSALMKSSKTLFRFFPQVSVVQRRCRLRTFTKATSVPNTVILNHRKCVGCWGFLCYVSASLCNRLTHQWNQLPQLNPDADIRSQSTVISLLKLLHQTLKYLLAKQAKRSVADYMNKHKTNFLHLRNQCPHRNN